MNSPSVAVLIPCYNEENTVASVIDDFRAALPNADIYVYDNNSSDKTIETALSAGAIVKKEQLQGKGNVVRRMFADIEADVYILVDGDGTYDAKSAGALVSGILENDLDMVNAKRISRNVAAYRKGHRLGNFLLSSIVRVLFGSRVIDLLSGYRAFSKRFVKSFPALSLGFEIETELTVHALDLKLPVSEIDTPYYSRPEGSSSKLSTYKDGIKIFITILNLVKYERPLAFFSFFSAIFSIFSAVLFYPVLLEYFETGLVPRFPTAILSTGLMLLSFLCFFSGLILDTVSHGRREMKRLNYLAASSFFNTPGQTGRHAPTASRMR